MVLMRSRCNREGGKELGQRGGVAGGARCGRLQASLHGGPVLGLTDPPVQPVHSLLAC